MEESFLHPSDSSVPSGFGAGATSSQVTPKVTHAVHGGVGVPALGGTQGPPQLSPVPLPSTPRFLQEGSCCHLLAALSPAKRCWGHRGQGHEVGDAGMVAQQWPRDGAGMGAGGGPGRSCPTPDPLAPVPTDTHRHHGLYPPVMVTASRRLPAADPWGTASAWGRAASGEAGPDGRQRAGGRWPGGVSCGTAVSSLAGVTWGGRLPWGDAPSSLAPRRGAGRRQSPCSGRCLGRRSC